MRTRFGLVLAFSIAVVVALGNQRVSAQGSPPEPTGGGWAKQVTGTDDFSVWSPKARLTWSGSSIGLGRFVPRTWTTLPGSRPWIPAAQGRYWWGVKVAR